jgi:redox-sensitive bicupin YhaK (pirin superfamily)
MSPSRTIARVVPPTRTNPAITRLIGTVDIDGAGTAHPLAEADPFILLDFAKIDKNAMPPFGAHPHFGHSVATILLAGKVRSRDSIQLKDDILQGPGTCLVDAGSGLFHDEVSVIDDEQDPTQHMKLFQLWMGVKDADRSKPARVQFTSRLPTVECVDPQSGDVVGCVTYYLGDKTLIETLHPILVMHIQQRARTTYHVPTVPTHGGFVVHMLGRASYGEVVTVSMSIVEDINTVLVLNNTNDSDGPDHLLVTTEDDTEYLVCSGERIREPWVKKLVANGALFAKTVDQARELATKVEEMAKAVKAQTGM